MNIAKIFYYIIEVWPADSFSIDFIESTLNATIVYSVKGNYKEIKLCYSNIDSVGKCFGLSYSPYNLRLDHKIYFGVKYNFTIRTIGFNNKTAAKTIEKEIGILFLK